MRILYGGDRRDGSRRLSGIPFDGGLVGGASLDPGDFAAIVGAA